MAEKKGLLKEFREFIASGNMIELAVAVILAAAVGDVIKSFTNGIMMQIIAAIFGQPDFSNIKITLRHHASFDKATNTYTDATLQIGAFINTLITLVLTGLVLFAIVKAYNRMKRKQAEEVAVEPAGPTEIELLAEIRDALKARS
ncbi:MAG TPA: large conductance mechanosensitive channel protein MscL [Ilumatobacteraceae bacterium]|jgi:large conductance mechanosensitive channel